jgi:hypothetical protein
VKRQLVSLRRFGGVPFVAAAITAAAVAGCTTSSTATPVEDTTTSTPTATSSEVAVGIAVPGGDPLRVAEIEARAGQDFELIRLFARWEDVVPDSGIQTLIESGHAIHLSVRPRRSDGSDIPWAQLAEAGPGDPFYDEMMGWIDRILALPAGTYITINHEPETRDSAPSGTAEDFVAMWRRFAQLLRERGGADVPLVWTMTGGAFRGATATTWYPGDDVVDVIAGDLYNWHRCQGSERDWVSFEDLLAPVLAFAEDRDKPVAVPEFASVEDPADPERKAAWIRSTTEYLLRPEVADQVAFVAWFDVTGAGGEWVDCVWDHDSSAASTEAFDEMIRSLGAG